MAQAPRCVPGEERRRPANPSRPQGADFLAVRPNNAPEAAVDWPEMDEAMTALVEARRLYPKLSVKWLSERKPILQPAFEVLRKAGLPEE